MRVSRDLEVLKALSALLEGINPDNGVVGFDLRGKVFRGRQKFGDDQERPFLSISDDFRVQNPRETDFAAENNRLQNWRWSLLLQGFANNDPENPTDEAYLLKAYCSERLGRVLAEQPNSGFPVDPDNYMLGKFPDNRNRICGMTINIGAVYGPTPDISTTAFFYMPLVIQLEYDPLCPFIELP